MSEAKVQTELFTRRSHQLRLRDAVQFPPGKGCQPVSLKGVLVAVDSFAGEVGWCFASHKTIADRANVSLSTAVRALQVLGEEGLLRKQRRRRPDGSYQCRYQIFWVQLQAYIEEQKAAKDPDDDGWEEVYAEPAGELPEVDPSVSTTRPKCQSKGGQVSARHDPSVSRGRPKCQPDTLTTKEPQIDPPQQPASVVDDGIQKAFEEVGIGRSEAKRYSQTIDRTEATDLLTEYRYGLSKGILKSQGAICYRIREGTWPAVGMPDAETIRTEAEAARSRKVSEESKAALESARKAAQEKRSQNLERRFGGEYDAMSEAQRREIAKDCLTKTEYELFQRHGSIFRIQLLEAMEERSLCFG